MPLLHNLKALLPSLAVLALVALVAGCATGPDFQSRDINRDLSPRDAVTKGEDAEGEHVLWGGRIIGIRTLKDSTQLEVLAHPLTRSEQPDPTRPSQGRFLIIYPDYLEPADWSNGRLITTTGPVESIERGRIGEADYIYPVVRGDKLHLWPARQGTETGSGPQFRFGFGLLFSR